MDRKTLKAVQAKMTEGVGADPRRRIEDLEAFLDAELSKEAPAKAPKAKAVGSAAVEGADA